MRTHEAETRHDILVAFSMGCLSSRSTIAPSDTSSNSKNTKPLEVGASTKKAAAASEAAPFDSKSRSRVELDSISLEAEGKRLGSQEQQEQGGKARAKDKSNSRKPAVELNESAGGKKADRKLQVSSETRASAASSVEAPEDDIMSILMGNQDNLGPSETKTAEKRSAGSDSSKSNEEQADWTSESRIGQSKERQATTNYEARRGLPSEPSVEQSELSGHKEQQAVGGEELDDESNELLRQYVAVDFEIGQLEDKDALRVYHEKIEQLEQLERELDMISGEVEKVANARSSTAQSQLERLQSISSPGSVQAEPRLEHENNSLTSAGSGSRKSWLASLQSTTKGALNKESADEKLKRDSLNAGSKNFRPNREQSSPVRQRGSPERSLGASSRRLLSSYSTAEEVFNRKIILEKERDKLKKEVELVIVECDKLQQRYKRRDEILDKLFDGRRGNGLENHLEQQLNWLLEQKHYVDQVFYSWKRAERLTAQTCDQFSAALELFKKLPQLSEPNERAKLAQNVASLLIKSRQDLELAQKYNPNVDAPFFTDNETERFEKILESISANSISPNQYNQVLTVIQIAYKRALSIRVWLEQVLQTTIARDSFELGEEYKWIAIQLRKERINLVKTRLQEPGQRELVEQVQEEMRRQQSLVESRRQQHEINRDSGVESETNDIDIEGEIYRLLELNKARLERPSELQQNQLKEQPGGRSATTNQASTGSRDQVIRNRIKRRLTGDLKLHMNQVGSKTPPGSAQSETRFGGSAHASEISHNNSSLGAATPTKLRIQLDEEARQSLLSKFPFLLLFLYLCFKRASLCALKATVSCLAEKFIHPDYFSRKRQKCAPFCSGPPKAS